MEPGLYVTFFTKDEPASRELPPVGPLDNVVLRQHLLLAERRTIHQAVELGVTIDRWLEAELEMQRAVGEEPGSPKRAQRRFSARDGVYLRFAVFGDPHERDLVPELGPFAVVVVGPLSLDADGSTLARRTSSELAAWELAEAAGGELAGLHKPDVALRTSNTTYHPSIAPLQSLAAPSFRSSGAPTGLGAIETAAAPPPPPPPLELPPLATPSVQQRSSSDPPVAPSEQPPIFTDRPRRPTEIYSVASDVPDAEPPTLTAEDRTMIDRLDRERRHETLRARINSGRQYRAPDEEGQAAEIVATRYRPQEGQDGLIDDDAEARLEWGPALWRMRFAIIGVLLLVAALYGFLVLRTGTSLTLSGTQQVQYVAMGQRFGNERWEFVVNGVQRVTSAGTARARGFFYVVRLGVTNKGAASQELAPGDFTIVDVDGTEYGPIGLASGAYQTSETPGAPYVWPPSFPNGAGVSAFVIFDLDAGVPRGLLLKVSHQPGVQVRLD